MKSVLESKRYQFQLLLSNISNLSSNELLEFVYNSQFGERKEDVDYFIIDPLVFAKFRPFSLPIIAKMWEIINKKMIEDENPIDFPSIIFDYLTKCVIDTKFKKKSHHYYLIRYLVLNNVLSIDQIYDYLLNVNDMNKNQCLLLYIYTMEFFNSEKKDQIIANMSKCTYDISHTGSIVFKIMHNQPIDDLIFELLYFSQKESLNYIARYDEVDFLTQYLSVPFIEKNPVVAISSFEFCSFIRKANPNMIKACAYFGSLKCFKQLIMNGVKLIGVETYVSCSGDASLIQFVRNQSITFDNCFEMVIKHMHINVLNWIYDEFRNENIITSLTRTMMKIILQKNIIILFPLYFDFGGDVNEKILGFPLLFDAIILKNYTIINFLVEYGKIDLKYNDFDLGKPLFYAFQSGNYDIMFFLLNTAPEMVNDKCVFTMFFHMEFICFKSNTSSLCKYQ